MKDLVLVVTVVLAFALAVTAHSAIVYGLAFRTPRWRALVAFALPPLGGFWAWRERMYTRASLLLAAVLVYGLARLLAQ